MNRLYRYVRGYYRISVTGAGSDLMLNRLVRAGIPFWSLQWEDELTMYVCVFSSDLDTVKKIALHCLCLVENAEYIGMREKLELLLKRPVMVLGVLFSVLLVLVMQNFLMFFEVQGNEKIPADKILRALDEIDVDFGVTGATIKPKQIKDHILNMLPQLQWITVTQNGAVARVVVRERTQTPATSTRKGLANVVAAKPAMITQQFVFEGQALKAPGDFVSKGEMLVSGVVDLERTYMVVRAHAEIYGRTWYQKTVLTPENCLNKELDGRESWCIWMEIGKRRIKIFGNSRIYDTDCDKITISKSMTLPGGYALPVAIIAEKCEGYIVTELSVSEDVAEDILQEYAKQIVAEELCAGEVLEFEHRIKSFDGYYCLEADFTCHEMISEILEGKWNEEDFQND